MSKFSNLLMRVPVPWVFILGYLIGIPFQLLFQLKLRNPAVIKISFVSGVALFIIAVVIASWCLIIFHKARTTTTPGLKSSRLIMTGPYRFSRNPMYISLIVAYFGEAAMLNQIIPLFILLFIFYYVNNIIIPVEEDLLTKEFNGEYSDYQKRIHRWL